MDAAASPADPLIRALLRGERPSAAPWPQPVVDALVPRAVMHGVETLLYRALKSTSAPESIAQQLRRHAVAQLLWERTHAALLRELLPALDAAGAEPVVLKGTALAHSLYPEPALRPRADTDLLVAPSAREAAQQVLLALGYVRNTSLEGPQASSEASFSRVLDGQRHTVDLHWRISNSPLLARLFSHQELRQTAVAVAALSPHARAPEAVQALLIAAFHRQAHVHAPYYVNGVPCRGDLRLIWLYDIDLLARSLDRPDWLRLVQLASDKGLLSVCRQALRDARDALGTPEPPADLAWRHAASEAPARYFAARGLQRHWMDLAALPDWRARLLLLKETGLPPASYMRQRYPRAAAPLCWLYLQRAWGGFMKAIRPTIGLH